MTEESVKTITFLLLELVFQSFEHLMSEFLRTHSINEIFNYRPHLLDRDVFFFLLRDKRQQHTSIYTIHNISFLQSTRIGEKNIKNKKHRIIEALD